MNNDSNIDNKKGISLLFGPKKSNKTGCLTLPHSSVTKTVKMKIKQAPKWVEAWSNIFTPEGKKLDRLRRLEEWRDLEEQEEKVTEEVEVEEKRRSHSGDRQTHLQIHSQARMRIGWTWCPLLVGHTGKVGQVAILIRSQLFFKDYKISKNSRLLK